MTRAKLRDKSRDVARAPRHSPRRGVVLIAVIWAIALMSALALAAATHLRGFTGVLAIDRDHVQAEALFAAGLEAAADALIKLGKRPLAPMETRLALATGAVRARLSDDLGRIDVNKAPLETLAALFAEIGAENPVAQAQALILWRDGAAKPSPKDDAPKLDAKKSEAAFSHVAQIAEAAQIGPEIVAAAAPFTTVFGDATVNALTAEPRLLAFLPEMTPARLDALLAARAEPNVDIARIEQALGPAAQYAKPKSEAVARVALTATLTNGFVAAAEAVLVALPGDKQPYRILFYRQAETPQAYGARGL
jgi:general secretion pathway protein K